MTYKVPEPPADMLHSHSLRNWQVPHPCNAACWCTTRPSDATSYASETVSGLAKCNSVHSTQHKRAHLLDMQETVQNVQCKMAIANQGAGMCWPTDCIQDPLHTSVFLFAQPPQPIRASDRKKVAENARAVRKFSKSTKLVENQSEKKHVSKYNEKHIW